MKSLDDDKVLDKEIEASKGGGSKLPFFKFQDGKNYFALAMKKFDSGYRHWLGKRPIASVDNDSDGGGWNPDVDPIDEYCNQLYSQARELDDEGDKDRADALRKKGNKMRSSLMGAFVVYPGKLVVIEKDGDEKEVIRFKTKSFTAEPQMMSLSEARHNAFVSKLKEWKNSEEGVAKDFGSATILDYIICAEKSKTDGKISWSLVSKINPKQKLTLSKEDAKPFIDEMKEAFTASTAEDAKEALEKFLAGGSSNKKSSKQDEASDLLDDDDEIDDDDAEVTADDSEDDAF